MLYLHCATDVGIEISEHVRVFLMIIDKGFIMEARRNLEAVYKRRLEDAEKRRFQEELHLNVLKQYMSLVGSTLSQPAGPSFQMVESFFTDIQRLLAELKRKLASSSVGGQGLTLELQDKIWQDSLNIARLQLDKLDFEPKSFSVASLLTYMTNVLRYDRIDAKLKATCLNTDSRWLLMILHGTKNIFDTMDLHVVFDVSHDSQSGLLRLSTTETHNKFGSMKSYVTDVASLFENRPSADVHIDDVFSTYFVCKGLAQSTGGDVVMSDDYRTLDILLPCEISDASDCPPLGVFESISEEPTVTIPISQVPPATPEIPATTTTTTEPAKERSIKGKVINILLLEDDVLLRQIFVKYWRRREPTVTIFEASDGMEAVEMFKKQRFSICFIDIEVPYISGLEVAKLMRRWEADNKLPRTPLIGVSGYSEKKYRDMASEAGMDDFIDKGQGYQLRDVYRMVVEYCGD